MLKSILKFARPRILVTCYALVFLGSAATSAVTLKTIFAVFVLVAWYIHAASANDYSDRYIDRINLKHAIDRPLIGKEINYRTFWLIHYVSGLLALLISSFYGAGAVIFTIGMLILDYAYSFKPIRVSDRGILSQYLLAFAYVFYPFSLGYWSVGSLSSYPLVLPIGIYLGFIGRLLLKDFRDVKGDEKHGKKTFLLRHGVITTCILSGVFWLLGIFIIGYSVAFTPGVMVPLVLGVVVALFLLKKLSQSKSMNIQLGVIAVIAKTANSSIIMILTYLLCLNAVGLSNLEVQILPTIVGVTLLLLACLSYWDLRIDHKHTG